MTRIPRAASASQTCPRLLDVAPSGLKLAPFVSDHLFEGIESLASQCHVASASCRCSESLCFAELVSQAGKPVALWPCDRRTRAPLADRTSGPIIPTRPNTIPAPCQVVRVVFIWFPGYGVVIFTRRNRFPVNVAASVTVTVRTSMPVSDMMHPEPETSAVFAPPTLCAMSAHVERFEEACTV